MRKLSIEVLDEEGRRLAAEQIAMTANKLRTPVRVCYDTDIHDPVPRLRYLDRPSYEQRLREYPESIVGVFQRGCNAFAVLERIERVVKEMELADRLERQTRRYGATFACG